MCGLRGGIGAGFRELRGVKGFFGALLAAALLAGLATWAFFSASAGDLRRDPTEVAGDAFTVWEQWDGEAVAESPAAGWGPTGERPAVTRFAAASGGAEVWHTTWKPEPLQQGFALTPWGGGWLSGLPDALALWSETPGEMARHWRPRRDGHVRLEATGNPLIPFRSTWTSPDGTLLTEWHAGELEAAPLPLAWGGLWDMPEQDERWHKAALRRVPGPLHAADSVLLGRWDGTLARLERTDGAAVELWGWADSTGVREEWEERGWGTVQNAFIGARGLWRVYAAEDGTVPEVGPWAAMVDASTLPGSFAWDQGERGPEGVRTARFSHDGRLTWAGGALATREPAQAAHSDSTAEQPEEVVVEGMPEVAVPEATAARTLGRVRNHRTGGRMEIRWTGGELEAVENGSRVWALPSASAPVSVAFEVDLYRNGKYQTAVAFADGVWLIDVLGKQAPGYPLRVGSPVTALHVADYDRDAQFRFLIGTRDGRVHNYRDEAALTPGWTVPKGTSAVTQLAHLRVASKDYIYVGHADGSVKLLARSGEDRAKTPVKVKSSAAPAFRLAGDIERSTVLFIDASGTVREQSLGDARPAGLDGKVKGEAVSTSDRNGDGVPEVVVRAGGKERVFDARGREVGGGDASRRD